MGVLYVVATPIGNLEDLTARAARVLAAVPVVAAEDTRRTRKLLNHLGAHPRLIAYHADSPERREDAIVACLREGDVALVTDAGTPGLADPGPDLVARARREEILRGADSRCFGPRHRPIGGVVRAAAGHLHRIPAGAETAA